MTSPLVLGLLGTLAVLALLSYGLWEIISRRAADNAFQRASDTLTDGDYLNAIREFDRFLELAPDDPRAGKARVRRSLAGVQRFLTGGGQAWTEALKAARGMIRNVGDEPAFRDARAEAAATVLTIAEGLADRARQTANPSDLDQIDQAIALHDTLAGAAAPEIRERSRLPEKLSAARAAVRKALTRQRALAAMDDAIRDGSAAGIYQAHDSLISEYPDLADDRAVIERMTRANELLRQAVVLDETTRDATTGPRPEPLGPPTSLVIRSVRPGSSGTADGSATVVFALVEGLAYGLSSVDGAPLWHRPVGLNSPFPPLAVGGRAPSALIVDSRYGDLLRLDAATGRLLWRLPLEGPATEAPLVLGNQVFQTTSSGKLLRIDLESGRLTGTLDLKVPLDNAPVADELGRHLYLVAKRSVLYVLSRDPLACVGVEYLGHENGSIPCPPTRVGRYLILPENHQLTKSRWRIFLLSEDGSTMTPRQQVGVPGWTWGPPATGGSVLWALGDRGGLTAYAIGAETEPSPLKSITSLPPDAVDTGPAFTKARTERELWLSSNRIARYDLNPERGALQPAWTVVNVGPAKGPIQTAGRRAVFTQQPDKGLGTVLLGIDTTDGTIAWRTTLGRPWPVAPLAASDGDGLDTIGIDGRRLRVPRAQLESGGFVELVEPAPGAFRMPPRQETRLRQGTRNVLVPAEGARQLLVADGSGPLHPVDLPAPLAASPRFWGDDLLIPAADGLVYLIDPRTGATRADPYVPPYERDRPYRWLRPTPLDGGTIALVDEAGRIRRLALQDGNRRRLILDGEALDLGSPPTADPASTVEALILATADAQVRSLSARDLSPIGAWPVAAPPKVGPASVGDGVILADASGMVLMFGPDGQKRWEVELEDGPPVAPPTVLGDDLWFLDRGGNLERRSLADGSRSDRVSLHALPTGGAVALGDGLAVPLAPGTVCLFTPVSRPEVPPTDGPLDDADP